ncbi:FAD-dependent pyridine nucleotide-disulphide oxidoreductase [Desulfofarcimen acetoxidans DSM 771]|uniref:FAD-dependent pyridine nucleotide-disulphide oxidoreductase n=1 Tax=Desulfofarcimen acetoxidans (strain ATCC 49208 / DSM 771 / KCTC 5769 / VKM B-1644 / 5575) TaxID=485916 RepID=C8W087_DESAS|nr:FAD-dependent oxidoreductase [Desulfofarcimen acetoxidans]ACV63142.1 FAD-dependent pyridine nucleotide-disulphide oxidoreductase [Desulfofarcimen acetoxidans DSM 771]
MKVVIVGSSAAGITAAETLRFLNKQVQITVISEEPDTAYSRCLLPEVLAGFKNLAGIRYRSADFYTKNNIDLRLNTKVAIIEPLNYSCKLEDGEVIKYDRLLIATGAAPVRPSGLGSELDGIFTLRSYRQTLKIGQAADTAEQVVVSGGGLVSLKGAYALRQRGVQKVSVVVKSPHLLTRQLDEVSAAMIEKELTGMGIEFIFGLNQTGFEERKGTGKVAAVVLEDGSDLPAGLVLVGKGVTPNAGLLKNAGGQVNRGIVVNEFMETSIAGVYAAGDCIEVTDRLSGQRVSSALWTLAVEQGRCAAYNMLDIKRIYPNPLTALNSAQFGDIPFVSVGNALGSEESEIFTAQTGSRYCRLVLERDRLVGFILAGCIERAGVYTALVRKGSPVTNSLKSKLLNGTVCAADLMLF